MPMFFTHTRGYSTPLRFIACLFVLGVYIATSAFTSELRATMAQDASPLQWFRTEVPEGSASGWFRFAIDPEVADSESVQLTIVTDCHCSLYVNGQRILKHALLKQSGRTVTAAGYDVKSLLRQGRNSLAVEVNSERRTAVFGLSVVVKKGAESQTIGGLWKQAPAAPPVGWTQTDFNDRDWTEVRTVADEPRTRFKIAAPSGFAAPVIPAKTRTAPFQFEDGDRVVFVGATFFERAHLSEHLEATLAGTLGDKHVTFRNLGWSADTVFADSRGIFDKPDVGYLRLVEHIRAEEPTVAFICYGQNEALTAGMTPEQYSQQLGRLLDELNASGIACMLWSPHEMLRILPPIPSPSRFNSKIKIFSEATGSVAQARGLLFVDMFSDFSKRMREIDYEINSCFKLPSELEKNDDNAGSMARVIYHSLAENGMHLTDCGYACASAIVRERLLSIPARLPVVMVDPGTRKVESNAAEIRNIKWNPDDATFITLEIQEKYLSSLPLVISIAGETAKSIRVYGGTIQLDQETEPLTERPFPEASGHDASQGRSFAAPTNPQYEVLRQLLQKKNELYFHRWRPQNITYLFGFRKHEQGNNAADIAKFDPFILELEKQIHELQKPQWRTVTIRAAK